jgi:hypothetical protein
MRTIRISAGAVTALAVLNDSPTADAVWKALPLSSRVHTWGKEIYFEIPVRLDEAADARDEMEVGEIAYWSPGCAFCIFFGRTPASRGNEPRAASAVNVFGRVEGDATVFAAVPSGAEIRVAAAP